MYEVNVIDIGPALSIAQQDESFGKDLWARDPDRCCALRKVEPLERALEGMDAWITGIRRAQSVTRRNAKVLELDPRGVVKVQPLAGWSDEDVKGYLFAHDVPYNPLHDRGFPSIGCTPCTRAIRPGEDSRAGRWADAEKTECGLQLPAQGGPN
jgi:phosphoadenosine phosphosulfate reductase